MTNFLPAVAIVVWFLLLLIGGFFLVQACFTLRPTETWITAIGVGICVEVVITALLAPVLKAPVLFYLSAVVVFALGLAAYILSKQSFREITIAEFSPWIVVIPVFLISFLVCRGMAIFDDYAHLPTISLMAAGRIPPPFAYDPSVTYAYHYFLMLFAAQIMRVGDILPWTAFDLARAISFTLAVILAGYWTMRFTRSKVAGVIASLFIAFGSGTRWLVFFLPTRFLEKLSEQVTLIGSGANSGATFWEAILSNWRIEGAAKLPIPFAFTNGIVQPGVLSMHGANGLMEMAILLMLLMTYDRWRNKYAAILTVIVLSSLSLVGEIDLLLLLCGWGLIAIIQMVRARKIYLNKTFAKWGLVLSGAFLMSLLEGGALLNIVVSWFSGKTISYPEAGLVLSWPPAVISPHLGVLPLLHWRTLVLSLLEIGPILLVAPFLVLYWVRCIKQERWFESFFILSFFLTMGSVILNYEGVTGVRNTIHLYLFILLFTIYFVPVLWEWAVQKGSMAFSVVGMAAMISILGGLVLFAVQLPSLQMSIESTFLNELDAKVMDSYWNKLGRNAMVFDTIPSRSVTVFGRPVNAGTTWYDLTEKWKTLSANPDPYQLKMAGYDYAYLDEESWAANGGKNQEMFHQACVKPLESLKAWPGLIRKLFDISACVR